MNAAEVQLEAIWPKPSNHWHGQCWPAGIIYLPRIRQQLEVPEQEMVRLSETL